MTEPQDSADMRRPYAASVPLSASAGCSLYSQLKLATAPAHHALEQVTLMQRLASGTISALDYKIYVAHALALQSKLDQFVDGRLPTPLRSRSRRRLVWLLADAAALAVEAPELSPELFAPLETVLQKQPAVAWGLLYVQEGSALGGQVLIKANANNPTVRRACNHLDGSGAATGAIWRAFIAALEDTQPDLTQVTAGAIASFELYQRIFSAALFSPINHVQ